MMDKKLIWSQENKLLAENKKILLSGNDSLVREKLFEGREVIW